MKYTAFKYLYPPRPEFKTNPSELANYDRTCDYIAQPKYNGSACIVFTNSKELHIYNRHKEPLSKYSDKIEFLKLAKSSNWFVYAGEYLNKSKADENGIKENDKYIIWDVIVWDGLYLIGKTLQERLELLEHIYPCERAIISSTGKIEMFNHLCCTEFKGIYKAPTYLNGFADLYNELIQTDLYEGVVLKKSASKLQFGFNEKNNTDWQVKCRKETKLYNF